MQPFRSPVSRIDGSALLTEAQEKSLVDGTLYVNIHTEASGRRTSRAIGQAIAAGRFDQATLVAARCDCPLPAERAKSAVKDCRGTGGATR